MSQPFTKYKMDLFWIKRQFNWLADRLLARTTLTQPPVTQAIFSLELDLNGEIKQFAVSPQGIRRIKYLYVFQSKSKKTSFA